MAGFRRLEVGSFLTRWGAWEVDEVVALLFFGLHPSTSAVGVLRTSAEMLRDELKPWIPRKRAETALVALEDRGAVWFDPATSLVGMEAREWLELAPPQSPNVVRSWRAAAALLPPSVMLDQNLAGLGAALRESRGEAFAKAFTEAFPEGLPEGLPKGLPKGFSRAFGRTHIKETRPRARSSSSSKLKKKGFPVGNPAEPPSKPLTASQGAMDQLLGAWDEAGAKRPEGKQAMKRLGAMLKGYREELGADEGHAALRRDLEEAGRAGHLDKALGYVLAILNAAAKNGQHGRALVSERHGAVRSGGEETTAKIAALEAGGG